MKGYKHLTKEQQERCLQTYQDTLSVAATATAIGGTKDQVRHLLKKNGIAPSREKGGQCYQHVAKVREWASAGVAVSEIARRIGTTSSKVSAFLKKHSIPRKPFRQTMENNPAWKGGRVVDDDGYVLLKAPDHPHADRHGYVREHRLVMEQVLGRFLLPGEVVHHKERGNRQDNRPENLQLYSSNAEHLAEELSGRTPEWSEEGKQKIREGSKKPRPPISEETRRKLSEASRRPRNLTPEGRESLRESGRLLQARRRAAILKASEPDDPV